MALVLNIFKTGKFTIRRDNILKGIRWEGVKYYIIKIYVNL